MTIQIQLSPAIESGLAGLARLKGLPLIEYIQSLLESFAMPGTPLPSEMTPEQRADALLEWTKQFPYKRKAPLPDEAISRESIYGRAGNE
jgi:hypothetical protein